MEREICGVRKMSIEDRSEGGIRRGEDGGRLECIFETREA